jgi:group II intron reverse transcriptase/maturase
MAIRKVYSHLKSGRPEVVDGDLRDYFNAIPHGPLMKSVARRVSDGQVLSVIKAWLNAPVNETTAHGPSRTTHARDKHRGTPQGGVISPLLANVYFRRFGLAYRRVGELSSTRLVVYADDFVICCPKGRGERAMAKMKELMGRIGLEVNEEKTRLARFPSQRFDFLGYTFGAFYGRSGSPYWGTAISKTAMSRVTRKIHDATSTRWLLTTPDKRVEEVNRILRGWCGYFDQGPVFQPYRRIARYTERRIRRWLTKKHKQRGTGYRQYPSEHLYGTLGLFDLHAQRISRMKAKA